MGKAKSLRQLKDNEAKAVASSIRVSPTKLNLVTSMLRGKKVDKALAELTFSSKRIAKTVKKTLESAIANAENNHGLDIDSLIVSEAYVGRSMVLKRIRVRGRGRVGQILKPSSHLTIIVREVTEKEEAA